MQVPKLPRLLWSTRKKGLLKSLTLEGSRDGNKTRTHLQPTKPAPFETRMGDKSGLNGYGASMEKTGKDTGMGMGIGLTTPNPPRTPTRFLVR